MQLNPRVVDLFHGDILYPYKDRGLTIGRLRSVMKYDPETGNLVWLVSKPPRAKIGATAGSKNSKNGYIYVGIDGHIYLAHILIWFLQTGSWPAREVDHRDLDHSNNRWENLREATPTQNCINRPIRADSSNPYKGIRRKGSKWAASISIDKQKRYLGTFPTPEEAHAAYVTASKGHYGDFARSA